MGFFDFLNTVGVKKKTEKFTELTTGVVVGVSSVQVNSIHLPLVEYEVNGKKYKIRMAYDIAKRMEQSSMSNPQVVGVNHNFLHAKLTKIQGAKVKVLYNPDNPKEAIVVE